MAILQPQLFGLVRLAPPLQATELLRHSAHLLAMLLQASPTGAQARFLQLQINAAEKHGHHQQGAGVLRWKGKLQAKKVGRGRLHLDLTG